jgi:hypothetical protein
MRPCQATACRLFLLLVGAFGLGCETRSPIIVLSSAAIVDGRVRLLLESGIDVEPVEGASYPLGRSSSYLVSTEIGAPTAVRPEIAAVNAGDPTPPARRWDFSCNPPKFRQGAADDRVVRRAEVGGTADTEQIDVLTRPTSAPGPGAPWPIARSWRVGMAGPPTRARLATRSGRFVITRLAPATVLDVVTLAEVPIPGLGEPLRTSAGREGECVGVRLTANLNYVIVDSPPTGGLADRVLVVTDQANRVAARFPCIGPQGRALAVDEADAGDDPAQGARGAADVWCLYARYDGGSKRWIYTLVDREQKARHQIGVPHPLANPPGLQEAYWDTRGDRVLFYEFAQDVGAHPDVAISIWDYRAETLRTQVINLAGAFRVSGGRYVPRR